MPKSLYPDIFGTRLSPENEAKFRAWAVSQGITDVDHPENGIDYRAYWKEFAREGARPSEDDDEPAPPAPGATSESRGSRWVSRTFLRRQPPAKKSRLEAVLMKRRRR